MIEPVKHDWPKIIEDIEKYLSRHKLALMMRRQYNQVTQWSQGQRVEHYDGEMLLAIHEEYVPRETLSLELSHSQNTVESA